MDKPFGLSVARKQKRDLTHCFVSFFIYYAWKNIFQKKFPISLYKTTPYVSLTTHKANGLVL